MTATKKLSRLRIPKQHQPALNKLLSLSRENFENLETAARKVKPVLAIDTMAAEIASAVGLTEKEAEDILYFLTSMLLVREDRGQEVDEFVEGLMSDEDIRKLDGDLEGFREFISRALTIDTLRLVARGLLVMAERERHYCKAKVLTDIRPVFEFDVAKTPSTVVLAHTLKLSYHETDLETRDFYVALDSRELRELKEHLDRALAKEGSITSFLEAKGVRLIKMES